MIAVDAMGGDEAPRAIVEGAVSAARELGIPISLVGPRDVVEREVARCATEGLALRVVDAPEVVLMGDSPTEAVRRKPRSSIRVGLERVRAGEDAAFVSAGNSGAVLATAVFVLRNLEGIDRPAIVLPVPSARGSTLLLDAGANVECGPENLVQFAIMGSVFFRMLYGTPRPRVGIVSNGEESSKGTDLTRAADAVLRELPLEYVGYVEGRDLNAGSVDVAVTDGFTGNVILKTMEGLGGLLRGRLEGVFRSSWRTRLAWLLVRRDLAGLRQTLDVDAIGGAPLLGLSGPVILAHGASSPRAIRSAIRVAGEAVAHDLVAEIAGQLRSIPDTAAIRKIVRRRRGFWRQIRGRFRGQRDGEAGVDETGPEPRTPEGD